MVQRDRPDVMRAILDCPDDWPAGTAVMFDRRRADRRGRVLAVPVDRRSRQSGQDPGLAWLSRGFVVAQVSALPPQAAILRPQEPIPTVALPRRM